MVKCLLQASEYLGSFKLRLRCLLHALVDCGIESLALSELVLPLLIQFPDFVHEFLLLDLKFIVLLNELIEFRFKLLGDGISLSCTTSDKTLFF